MSLRTKLLFLGIGLLARMAFGEETITSFAKQSLGLDLGSVPFGMTAQTSGEYEKVGPPLSPAPMMVDDPSVSWMTNAASGKYHHDFPNRVLRYGFREGRLVAVRISIDSMVDSKGHPADRETLDQGRKELIRIQDEFAKVSPPGHQLNDDPSFRIHWGCICGPQPESLFLMEIQITPAEQKKAP